MYLVWEKLSMCVKAKSFKLRVTRDNYLHQSATIEAVAFSVLLRTVHSEISQIIYSVLSFFFAVRFAVILKLSNLKNIKVLEKDFQWLYLRSFNPSHVSHANTYLHTLCSKNKNTFYTSKDRLNNNYNFLA